MSASAASSAPVSAPLIGKSLALGLGFGLAAALFGAAALVFGGLAAFLSLLPYLEPRLAALAVAGASLVLAALIGWIGQILVRRSTERAAARIRSSLLIAMAPQILGLAARHMKLVGLASAVGAVFLAVRSSREN